jgi:hypothetical protein
MYVDWVHSQMRNYELALKAQVTTHGDIKLADFEAAP